MTPHDHHGERRSSVRRNVDLDELLIAIRRHLRVDYAQLHHDEITATLGRGRFSPTIDQVDVGAFLAWIRLGARLLSGDEFPSLRTVRDEATRMILALIVRREGTISGASRVLSTSRKVLRDNMQRVGLYRLLAAGRIGARW